ncbi:MAG: ATP-binding cassette domain-containing protein [Campylobacter sp.]|nr:ATP-binding cassette domain-containing protein [Campylobacter sp.]
MYIDKFIKSRYTIGLGLVFLLSIANSIYGVYILSFINDKILSLNSEDKYILVFFIAILLGYFVVGMVFKVVMAKVSNDFTCQLRDKLVVRVLGSSVWSVNSDNKSKILASLSSDIQMLSNGFMRLADAVQSGLLVLFSIFYFLYISKILGFFVLVWFAVIGIVVFVFIKKSYFYHRKSRSNYDELYRSYEALLNSHKELNLSAKRREIFIKNFQKESAAQKESLTKAEISGSVSSNFLSAMMLGGIGIVMYLSLGLGVAEIKTATTISFAILFLRAPFMMFISSLPSILMANIAMKKIRDLKLKEFEDINLNLSVKSLKWDNLKFVDIKFNYDEIEILNGVNLEINRGETVFLIGENGSGKSTLFMIMCGLYEQKSGEILIDGKKLDNLVKYQESLSVIFSEFYLFKNIINGSDEEIEFWLEIFKLEDRINVSKQSREFSSIDLSAGQKKRVALVLALLDGRDFIMLDEWAADQDPEFREYFYSQILPLLKKRGKSIFMISHDDRYFSAADKIYQMKEGKAIQIK